MLIIDTLCCSTLKYRPRCGEKHYIKILRDVKHARLWAVGDTEYEPQVCSRAQKVSGLTNFLR
jgi:hypothetical protein